MKKILVVLVAAALSWASVAIAQDQPVRSIVNVTGDLYRFQENNHYGVFLVTDEGIILADPISHDNAQWLKGQLAEQFGVPVKYVIYSHDHADHTSGGEVFADTATFVAHENAAPKIAASGHTPVPDETDFKNIKPFGIKKIVSLGGKRVELYFFGSSHSDNLISIYFPKERALFQVDSVAVDRLPYRDLPDYYLSAPNVLRLIYNFIDFKILIPGHGPIGTKKHFISHQKYLENLQMKVANALIKGLTVEEAKKKINLKKYKKWGQYENWRDLNIEGMYRVFLEEEEYLPFHKVAGGYPLSAARNGQCGWVIVQYDVDEEGRTKNIRVFDSEPKKIFDKAGINAAKKYRYIPNNPTKNVKTRTTYELAGICEVPPPRDINNE